MNLQRQRKSPRANRGTMPRQLIPPRISPGLGISETKIIIKVDLDRVVPQIIRRAYVLRRDHALESIIPPQNPLSDQPPATVVPVIALIMNRLIIDTIGSHRFPACAICFIFRIFYHIFLAVGGGIIYLSIRHRNGGLRDYGTLKFMVVCQSWQSPLGQPFEHFR